MPEEQNIAAAPRRRGRPRVEQKLERVSTRLPIPVYDRLVRVALQRDISVATLVRQLVILRLPPEFRS